MYLLGKLTLLVGITILVAQCGQKSGTTDESTGSEAFVPSTWDGSADYAASTWEFIAP